MINQSVQPTGYNINQMSIPWVESPFFEEILEQKHLSEEQEILAREFNKNGFIILDLNLTQAFIDDMLQWLLNKSKELYDQSTTYEFLQYTKYPRVFEAWKENDSVLQLAVHSKIMDTLRFLYDREPIPFQTINFFYGSKQPFHSDGIHFNSIPYLWVAASWIALEDMDTTNGTFTVIPTSHKLPFYDYCDIGIEVPTTGEDQTKYAQYEDFIDKLIKLYRFETYPFLGKRGQAIITAANLLHGGGVVTDESRTRYSQVNHYYFNGCSRYYCPMFTDRFNNKWADKDLNKKDIIGLAKSKNIT